MNIIKKLPVLLLLFSVFLSFGQSGIPERPNPPRLVNDIAGVLSQQEVNTLENTLVAFNDSTGTQIVVVTVNDIGDYDKAEFTYTLGQKWGVGQKDFSNGVVIMLKPHGQQGQRHAFIATGYGLEGVIPDAIAKRIVENEMIPYLKENKIYEGINAATNIVMGLASQEYTAEAYVNKKRVKQGIPAIAVIFIVFFFMILMSIAKKRHLTLGHKPNIWTLLFLMSQANRSHSGHFGNFSGGRGGFGGFGGGGFGGGGAGGSW